VVEHAVVSKINDFGDAVFVEAGQMAAVDSVVTRSAKHCTGSSLKFLSPTSLYLSSIVSNREPKGEADASSRFGYASYVF